jgi:hypothetical protein
LAQPRARRFARAVPRRALRAGAPARRLLLFTLAAVLILLEAGRAPGTALANPQLSLPTPPGERWRIIQGYNCGTHTGPDRYALDLVNTDGPTYGAPVRAAADGEVFVWVSKSGTLILSHGGGFYTQYTHLASAADPTPGRRFARGEVIGTVGDRGTRGLPHLHFMAFTADGAWARNRRPTPLAFVEGYDLPDIGGCSQHGGTVLIAGGPMNAAAEGVSFQAAIAPGHWYGADVAIRFGGRAMAGGFSAAWDRDPGGDAPAQAGPGEAHLAQAGEGLHTLFVRAWDEAGHQTLAAFGPVGLDTTPPAAPPAPDGDTRLAAGRPARLSWPAASDAASGIAGYRVYLGDDPAGTSEWFVAAPETETPPLGAGRYLLRVQPLDFAGNAGAWTTVGTVFVE